MYAMHDIGPGDGGLQSIHSREPQGEFPLARAGDGWGWSISLSKTYLSNYP